MLISQSYAQKQKLHTRKKAAIKEYNAGILHYNNGNIFKAQKAFELAAQIDTGFIEAYQMLAMISEDTRNYLKAIEYYEKVNRLKNDFFVNNYFFLTQHYLRFGEYEKAKKNIEVFLSYEQSNEKLLQKAQLLLNNIDIALELKNNPVPFKPINLGPAINTEFSEYSMTLTADEQTIYFTRLRPRDERTSHHHQFEEDFYYSVKENGQWQKARPVGAPINSPGNEGAGTISADGKIFIFTACNRSDGYGSCDLYMSKWENGWWGPPVNLGRPVNSEYWESQPSLAPDGKTLYFVSNRNGNEDIYVSTYENGKWSEPVNLGAPVNTSERENSPFIHPDGKTLYFMSNGHPGMGGMDIFMTRKNLDGTWTEPVNIGYPINTHADEGFFFVGTTGKYAYFASDRLQGYGKFDIYMFEMPENVKPDPVAYMKGTIRDAKTSTTLESYIEMINLETLQIDVFTYSDKSGNYLIPIPTNRKFAFNITAKNYLFYSESFFITPDQLNEQYEFHRDFLLQPIEIGTTLVLHNIFFDYDSDILKKESIAELNKLIEFLKNNPTVQIEISGHTDNIGSRRYNQVLSENRAKSVYLYLIEHGIQAERLIYKGYADTMPIASNETEEGRAKNRRTEIKIIKK